MSAPLPSPGLVHLAQIHTEHRNSADSGHSGSRSSLSLFPPVAHPERSWSWRTLRQEFQTRDSQKLFDKYQARLQHSFFVILLLMNITFNVAGVVLFYFDNRRVLFPGPVIMRATAIMIYLAFFALAWHNEEWLRPKLSRTVASFMILITMIFSEYGTALYISSSSEHNHSYYLQKIRPAFYLIVANHVFLPYPSRYYACIASIGITTIEVWLTMRTRIASDCTLADAARYAAADSIFYSVAALIGYLITHLLEIANRRGFLDHRKCMESKIRLDVEKEKEEQLLNSCIPAHLTERVRNDIKLVVMKIQSGVEITNPRPFNELYMEKYTDVSILYADIVNSMNLTSKLSPCDLIETLNDLYGRFDESAERNNCLRIKILGDCYYLVSGVPNYDENHAINCVSMGLDMIDIVRSVREERFVDINMRIGVHSGMVFCGLIGLNKWQYDIWSKDSMRASEMEHEGLPGKVHVTQTTLDSMPETALANLRVTPRDNGDDEQTYLIERKITAPTHLATCSPSTRRKRHLERLKKTVGNFRRRTQPVDNVFSRRSQLMADLSKYKAMVRMMNEAISEDIEKLPLSNKTLWLQQDVVNPLFLNYTRKAIDGTRYTNLFSYEMQYATQKVDFSLFRYYLYCALIIDLAIIVIKFLIPDRVTTQAMKWSLAMSLPTILVCLVYTSLRKNDLNYCGRLLLWMITSTFLIMCSTIDVVQENCLENYDRSKMSSCGYGWYYTFCLILSMTSCSVFIRANIWLKLMVYLSSIATFFTLANNPCSILDLLEPRVSWKIFGYSPHEGHLAYIVIVTLLLHMIDRQIEYILRLDFQWNVRLQREKEESATIAIVNKMLLENILPLHVGEKFLHTRFCDEVYSESYDEVAVLFASIPNFIDFYHESHFNDDGLKCLQILNEILCDFDKACNEKAFQRIEKIKTIGSTYMVASGLRPGQRPEKKSSTCSSSSQEDATSHAVCIVDFAVRLNKVIRSVNRDAMQDFQLRIGIAFGPVIAGVVGCNKPQYDIWGDTVNVASRMESTGVLGRIQCTKPMADQLRSVPHVKIQCRGPVKVKGKGELVTYFVDRQRGVEEASNC